MKVLRHLEETSCVHLSPTLPQTIKIDHDCYLQKLDQHAQRCRNAQFTCIDCNVDFYGTDYRAHTSCISEDQKYQKSVYKGPKAKGQPQAPKPAAAPEPIVPTPAPVLAPTSVSDASTSALPAVSAAPDASAESKKRAREEDTSATKKKSKKDKKKADDMDVVAEAQQPEENDLTVEDEAEGEGEADETAAASKASKKQTKKQKQKEKLAALNQSKKDALSTVIDPSLVAVGATPTPPPNDDIPVLPTPDISVIVSTPATAISLATPVDLPIAALAGATTIHAFLAPLLPTLLAESRSLASLRGIVVAQAAAAGFNDEKEVEKVLWEGVWIGGPKPKKQVMLNFMRVERATKKGKGGKSDAQ
ncbi:cell growth-regulating nucleolar protein, partial [Phenoliferia sp. Uapishka_3]